jgi:hypothetical protein
MIRIRQTVTEIETDTPTEAAELLQAMRPITNERGTVELNGYTTAHLLSMGSSEIMRHAQDDADYREYKANGGDMGRSGWSIHGRPNMPGGEVYDAFELELMGILPISPACQTGTGRGFSRSNYL